MTDIYALVRIVLLDEREEGEDCVGLYSTLGLARGAAWKIPPGPGGWRIYRAQLDAPAWPEGQSVLVDEYRP